MLEKSKLSFTEYCSITISRVTKLNIIQNSKYVQNSQIRNKYFDIFPLEKYTLRRKIHISALDFRRMQSVKDFESRYNELSNDHTFSQLRRYIFFESTVSSCRYGYSIEVKRHR